MFIIHTVNQNMVAHTSCFLWIVGPQVRGAKKNGDPECRQGCTNHFLVEWVRFVWTEQTTMLDKS